MVNSLHRSTTIRDSQRKVTDAVNVLGVHIHMFNRRTLTELLCEMLERQEHGWFSSVNAYAMNLAYELPWYAKFLGESLFTYCDGEGVRLASRILGTPLPERIGLTYWIYDILEVMEQRGWSVFFLGSTSAVVEKAVYTLERRYPKLRIAGYHGGYFSLAEDASIVEMINRAKPDLLFVGMGMPKQEQWILDHHSSLNVSLMTNAGSCIDSIVSNDLRVRAFMGRVGLEWFYRLLREPGRLWKRYLIGIPLFLARVLRARWTMMMHPTSTQRVS
jgi:N-acetylglucosaminyldiphosphoundecaprenol N-acetyl-beta-D-mannosaminyltransferase